ncbi:MAG: PorV/PorQ family protein [Elusimicrobia bacterium]|nr:PorV/PorQ family protein [Elusimicrobiota bacterium]
MRAAALAALLACASPAWAGKSDAGTTGAQFLKIAPGARPAAMGEAFSAVADDAHAVYYDPAGLARLSRPEATGMHDSHFQGIRYEFAAFALPLADRKDPFVKPTSRGALAFAIYNLSISGLERRGVNETDAPTDTFGASDFAYSLGYGIGLSSRASVGAAFKLIDQNLDNAKGSAAALDLGGLWTGNKLRLAAGARNLGSSVKFRGSSDPLPRTLYAGAAWAFDERRLVSLDVRAPRDGALELSGGAEYCRPFDSVTGCLRGGLNTATMEAAGLGGLSLGGGVGMGTLRFDLAWVPYGDLGSTFRYSLRVRF